MNEPKNPDDKGKEQDFREYADARTAERPAAPASSTGRSILRGCGIAVGIAFLVFAFVVGACFMSL